MRLLVALVLLIPLLAAAPQDRVLSGEESFPEGFTVPSGETWRFDPGTDTTVTVGGDVVVEGMLEMQPSSVEIVHTLQFEGIDESGDVGLWVQDSGTLDLRGTPRQGWNTTGSHPSWRPGDELVAEPGPEVANLTRNVRIIGGGSNPTDILRDDGRFHIHITSDQQQTIRHVLLRWCGPRASHDRDGTDGKLGRYCLHFHEMGDGSRGSEVTGVVVRDAGNHAFVPHSSHGITFTDTVAYDSYETPYWWDDKAITRDARWERALALTIKDHPAFRGYDLRGFLLGRGTGNTVVDSAAVDTRGTAVNAGGFHWPSKANSPPNVWTFRNNVAHHNRGAGISVWQNDSSGHVVEDSVSYANGIGISHGAYKNDYVFRGIELRDNDVAIEHHALPRGGDQMWEDITTEGDIRIVKHRLDDDGTVFYRNLSLGGKIVINESGGSGRFVFENSGLSRDDFVVESCTSEIVVSNVDETFSVC